MTVWFAASAGAQKTHNAHARKPTGSTLSTPAHDRAFPPRRCQFDIHRCLERLVRYTFAPWSATPLSRACSSRSTSPPCSRRRWSGWAPRFASACWRREAACRRSARLANQLGISRSTLRLALNTLVQTGHLVSLAGRRGGTFVAERPPLAERNGGPLGDDARAVLDLRVATEVGAAILAAERAGVEQLDRLDDLIETMARRRTSRNTGAPTSGSTSVWPRLPPLRGSCGR